MAKAKPTAAMKSKPKMVICESVPRIDSLVQCDLSAWSTILDMIV